MATIAPLLTAIALMATTASAAFADDASYPSKQIHIILGFAPGGAPDSLARIVGDRLARKMGQPVVVENRTGAAGNIAMVAVAKAPPDGYTLAMVPVGNAAVNPSLFPDLPYDLKQFAPITQIANVENVLVISTKSPIKSLAELIAYGKRKGADLTYATPGAGSIAHLAAELMARSGGFEARHVAYRGVTPALTDVLRGEVTMMFSQLSTAKPLIEHGELRALGVASKTRSSVLPNVPTVAEAGDMPGFEAVSWYALMAPAGTPRPIIDKIHNATVEAIKAPDAKSALEAQGAQPVGGTPAELSAVIATDTARWGKVIRDANIKLAP
ncbi:MAG: tripartite tricarboxylate transporter substrate binding protein [Xanthobacteraceae bacterium]|nr:tripartite tricarboxylate transporter substrate binding protein [Xanthobacteraceae bacterium]